MIQVIVRAIDILEFVAQQGKEPVKLITIAEHVKLSQPTCANIVKTLAAKNYLENVSRNEGYRLGSGAFHLTGNLSYNKNLILSAKDIMEDITRKVNETSMLSVLKNNKRHILHIAQSDQDLQVRAHIDDDIYKTASGRLLLAYATEKQLETLIQNIGMPPAAVWPEAASKEDLLKGLQDIRDEELVETLTSKHIVGLAVPVYTGDRVLNALSIFLPESRCTVAHKTKIIKELRNGAKKIQDRIKREI